MIRLPAQHRSGSSGHCPGDDVFPVDLVDVRTFSYVSGNNSTGTWYGIGQFLVELCHIYGVGSPADVFFTIVIKKNGKVVKVAFHFVMQPRTTWILGTVHLCGVSVYIGKDIKCSFFIKKGRSPYPVSIHIFSVLKTEFRTEVETVKYISD